VAVLDAKNRVVPVADNEITFELYGPARIIGVGNGNPSSHEADKPPSLLYDSHGALMFGTSADQAAVSNINAPQLLATRRCFNGLAQLIIQSKMQPGAIRVSARSSGLTSGVITLQATRPRAETPSVP
jgi:beta-galactosidase